jgi:hypothetical protein
MILYSNNEGGVWSEPVRLFHNPRHVFGRAQALAADHNGDLHMVVGTQDTLTNRPILMAAQRVGTSWSDPRVIATMGGAPAIAGDLNWLVVGYIRPAMPTGGGIDVNSVFAIRSGDGGATWRDTTMVHRSGTTPAQDPVVLATGGTIHMLWLQDRTGDVYAEAILHSESADGVAWSTPRVVAEPGSGIQSFAVVSDRFGRLHLVYQHSGGGGFPPQPPMRGFYTQWTGMRWSVPVQMFDWDGVGQVMSLTVSELDSLYLAATLSAADPLQELFLTSAYVGAATN